MRLALAVMASLLPLAAAQAAPPAANAPPANTPNTTPATTPTAAVGGGAPVVSQGNQAAATPATPAQPAGTPNANAPNAPNAQSNPPAAAPTPTPTTPTFQFDMNPSSVYTACQTQPIIWHYRPEPEKKNITLYVYNEEAVNADPDFAPEVTAGTIAKPNNNGRRSAPLADIVERQAGTRISQRIVKDWPANVAYNWVVDVPPGQYKFLAIVDGAGGDISYPLKIIADANMTCVKDFSNILGLGSTSSAVPSSSAAPAASSSGTKEKQPSASPTPSASASTSSKAAGAATNAGAQSDSDSKSSGISGGAIAGIVIGVLAGLALLALLAFCWRKKRRSRNDADYHVDPYSEPVREVRGGGGAFAPMASDHDSVHQTSSFGHDGAYAGVVPNPFETEPSTPVENTQTSHQTHTPNSSTGNASVYTAPMSGMSEESELAYPPPVGLAPVNNRASAQSNTSTFESAHTQAHPGSIQTFGHGSHGAMNSFPSNRTLASDASHFVPGSDAPPVPVPSSPTKAAVAAVPSSPRRLPPAPVATPQRLPPAGPSSPQRLPPAPTTPERNIAGGAPVPSAFAATTPTEPTLERKISSRRKPVPRLSEDEEAALGSSPPKGSPTGSAEGNASVLRLPKAVSSDGHDDWGSGLEAALNSTRKEYTLTADPPLRQD